KLDERCASGSSGQRSGVQLRGPEGAERPRAAVSCNAELGGCHSVGFSAARAAAIVSRQGWRAEAMCEPVVHHYGREEGHRWSAEAPSQLQQLVGQLHRGTPSRSETDLRIVEKVASSESALLCGPDIAIVKMSRPRGTTHTRVKTSQVTLRSTSLT